MNVVNENISKIHILCSKHKVTKLFVFGSVLTKNFKPESDIDFVVDFKDVNLMDYADNYFDLKFGLEKIFNRQVDLLEQKAVRNPYLLKSIESSKELIYGQ